MKLKDIDGSGALIEFTSDELATINNALNEICNGVGLPQYEFDTRMGCSIEEARSLLDQIHNIIAMPPARTRPE
jgi:hypothetical protein